MLSGKCPARLESEWQDKLRERQLFGSNVETCFVSTLFDNDVIDNPMSEFEPATSVQSQTV